MNMNENLTDMVQTEKTQEDTITEADLNLPSAEEKSETPPTIEENPETVKDVVKTIYLTDWFENYADVFEPDIKQLKTKISGLNPRSNIIVVMPHESNKKLEDGTIQKKVELFKRADEQNVLDLPGIDMSIYNNGFKIIHQYSEDVFLKTYGTKLGLIVSFCNKINDQLIPYTHSRLKKTEKELEVKFNDITQIKTNIDTELDKESLQLLYPQISKVIDTFTNKQSVIDWFLKKQTTIIDINHHLEIDVTISTMLAS